MMFRLVNMQIVHALDYCPLSGAAAPWPPALSHAPPGWQTCPGRCAATSAVALQSECHSAHSSGSAAAELRWLLDCSQGLPALSETAQVSSWVAFCLLRLLKIACELLLLLLSCQLARRNWSELWQVRGFYLSHIWRPKLFRLTGSCSGKARSQETLHVVPRCTIKESAKRFTASDNSRSERSRVFSWCH